MAECKERPEPRQEKIPVSPAALRLLDHLDIKRLREKSEREYWNFVEQVNRSKENEMEKAMRT